MDKWKWLKKHSIFCSFLLGFLFKEFIDRMKLPLNIWRRKLLKLILNAVESISEDLSANDSEIETLNNFRIALEMIFIPVSISYLRRRERSLINSSDLCYSWCCMICLKFEGIECLMIVGGVERAFVTCFFPSPFHFHKCW